MPGSCLGWAVRVEGIGFGDCLGTLLIMFREPFW